MGVLGWQLDWMILEVFSNLNDSVIITITTASPGQVHTQGAGFFFISEFILVRREGKQTGVPSRGVGIKTCWHRC